MSLDVEVPRKKMTRFLCQELMYEFVTGGLDPQRQVDMVEYLETCRDSQRELERLKRGLAFTEQASRVDVRPELIQALEEAEPVWRKALRDWTLRSSEKAWRWMPYAFVVATLLIGIVVLKPWQKLDSRDVILVEQEHPEVSPVEAATTSAPAAEPVTVPVPQPVALPPPPAPPTQQAAAEAEAEVQANAPNPPKAVGKGELSRAEMRLENFENAWPAIKDKIVAMGGKAAGSVELGWLRTPKESYFHFSLPESKYEELELFLGTLGPVRFVREKHPRVMPAGQIRIILIVKEADRKNEGPPETP